MFGLMRPRGCNQDHSSEAARGRRLHYCGTCKTMGKLYGQRSRMLLNNDAVFLAELLTELESNGRVYSQWSRALRSFNCAAMPKTENDMPVALRYAAAATLVMSEMKLQDRAADARPGNSRTAATQMLGRIYSQPFLTASADLKQFGVPMESLWSWFRQQHERETELMASRPAEVVIHHGADASDTSLAYLAEPTEELTGAVFAQGVHAVGAESALAVKMLALGRSFGRLVYLLDAYEDEHKDLKRQEFNAFLTVYHSDNAGLSPEDRERAISSILNCRNEVIEGIAALPLSTASRRTYTKRVEANVASIVGVQEASSCCTTRKPISETTGVTVRKPSRLRVAANSAKRVATNYRSECAGALGTIQAPFVFAMVLLTALVFPREVSNATTAAECIGILFNLMFWGAAFNAMLGMTQRVLTTPFTTRFATNGSALMSPMDRGIQSSSSGGNSHTTVVTTTRVRRRPSCCLGCECDCCCDGCCDACNCACCTCEACECASCACDSCSGCC